MALKIDKNYLGAALAHFDIDGNQIIEMDEWCAYFGYNPSEARLKAKDLLRNILRDVFPNESPERLPMLAEAILMNHSDQNEDGTRILNLQKLYDYVIKFIAPQKYRDYQAQLDDKTKFFLYDGVIELDEFDIFMDDQGRMICADVYYFLVSYNISPQVAEDMLNALRAEKSVDYRPEDYSLDAISVFERLSHEKNGRFQIDIDSILDYAKSKNINAKVTHVFHLFGIHNDLFKKIKSTQRVKLEDAEHFLGYQHPHYFELGLKMLLDALDIQLKKMEPVTELFDVMGYYGRPDRIFRELAMLDYFTSEDVLYFLQDNSIEAKIS
ncbi:MAG: hypothetical protein AAF621_01620 [Pseudomonadota bacterium]